MREESQRYWETVCLNREGDFHRGYLETTTGLKLGPETLLRPKTQYGNHLVVLNPDGSLLFRMEEGRVDIPIQYDESREDLLLMARRIDTRKRTDDGCFFATHHYFNKSRSNREPLDPNSVMVGFIIPSNDNSVRSDLNRPFGITKRELWLLREFLEDIYDTDAYDIFSVPLDGLWEKLQQRETEVGDVSLAISGE